MTRFSPHHFVLGVAVAGILGGAASLISGLSFWWLFAIALAAMLVNGYILNSFDD